MATQPSLLSGARLCLALAFAIPLVAQDRPLQPVPKIVEPSFIDTTCSPCKDFFQYANGAWLARDTIPAEYTSWGVVAESRERNEALLRQILDQAAQNRKKGDANTKRLGSYYATCMDSARADREGASPLGPELQRIAAIDGPRALFAEVARLHLSGVDALFGTYPLPDPTQSGRYTTWVYQGGLGMPDRDYYTRTDPTSDSLRMEYVAHVARTLRLLGTSASEAEPAARRILDLETRLAENSLTLVEQRDPHNITHKKTYPELKTLSPAFDWDDYFSGLGVSGIRDLNVATPKFFEGVDPLIGTVPIADWRVYLRWRLADAATPWLGRAFEQENFKWNARLTGRQALPPRWRRCLDEADNGIGESLGQAYVAVAFPPSARDRARDLVQEIRAAFARRVHQLEWMSDSTKVRAEQKLEAMNYKVGYPDQWRDYSRLTITEGPFVLNRLRAVEFENRRQLARVGQAVDRTEWGMTPPTINAYYNPLMNEMVLPAGQLRPPFFDPEADDAANYGGTGGGTIGHELTHGFDDEGRQYDAQGNLQNWWTDEDERRFNERAQKVVDQFNGFLIIDTLHVNGKLALGENLADFGGMVIAWDALQHRLGTNPAPALIDGFTPAQRFFLAYAQSWRSETRPETLRLRGLTDPHAPPRWRVNGPLANMPEFAKAFGCKAGDPMVQPDSLRAEVW
jgi:predicted metalloendopeptidase